MCLLGRGRTLSVNTLKLYHTSGSNHFAPSISDIEAIVGSGRFAGGGRAFVEIGRIRTTHWLGTTHSLVIKNIGMRGRLR